jgi:hypothetical protein
MHLFDAEAGAASPEKKLQTHDANTLKSKNTTKVSYKCKIKALST